MHPCHNPHSTWQDDGGVNNDAGEVSLDPDQVDDLVLDVNLDAVIDMNELSAS